jgi:hypothetical protein
MPIALIVGPAVALIGILAVVFVMRHKSVEKHSMYSARRSQIEHKVRAARQRTLTPHGHEEKPAAPAGAEAIPPPPPPPTFAPTPAPPTFSYEPSAYQPPPPAAPAAAPGQEATEPTPWQVGPAEPLPPPPPPPPAPSYDYPPAEPVPGYSASPPPAEQVWTPAPAPAEPLPPAEPVLTTTPAGSGASWSIVGETKDTAEEQASGDKKSKKDKAAQSGSWQLASGNAPGAEADEEVKRPSATMAIAQYAVLVVGLVMVLIGVLVMVANSHST